MSELGVRFFDGPSLLTGERVLGILTGLDKGSHNPKTGNIAQAWILRADKTPMQAVRDGSDDAICGDCKLRGDGATNRKCYVTPFFGPAAVFRSIQDYPMVTWSELASVMEARTVRLGAYGDPTAIGFEVWRQLLSTAAAWIGYTHQWSRCDQRFRSILMASVDDAREFYAARDLGWRTFRIRMADEPLMVVRHGDGLKTPLEFVCPASDEGLQRATCSSCQLCRGTSSPARNVVIVAHGKPSTLKAFGITVPFFVRRDRRPSVSPPQPEPA